MECSKIQEKLSEYIEDELSPAEKSSIDDHLRSCPKCGKALADMEMTIKSIRGLEDIIPPPWLTQKIMSRIKAEADQKKKSLWQKLFFPLYIKLPMEAVGVLLIAITALYVFKNMGPGVKNSMAPSGESVTEYTAKEKDPTVRKKANTPSKSPDVMQSKKDETDASVPSPQQSSLPPQPPAQASGHPLYDKEAPVKEKRAEEPPAAEKDMLLRSAPAPARPAVQNESKQEVVPQAAGKGLSGLPVKEDVSISFTAADSEQAKKNIKEILSNLGGRVIKEESSLDSIIIIDELDSDKLLPLIRKLKMLGYLKEKTPTPLSDKDKVLIKITVLKP